MAISPVAFDWVRSIDDYAGGRNLGSCLVIRTRSTPIVLLFSTVVMLALSIAKNVNSLGLDSDPPPTKGDLGNLGMWSKQGLPRHTITRV